MSLFKKTSTSPMANAAAALFSAAQLNVRSSREHSDVGSFLQAFEQRHRLGLHRPVVDQKELRYDDTPRTVD